MDSEALRVRMAVKNITQKELANKIGISPAALNNKLHKKVNFDIDEAMDICKALDIRDSNEIVNIFFS